MAKVATSIGVTSTDGKAGVVLMMEWMNVATAGPARTGRVEAVIRAIFLSAEVEAILKTKYEFCCLLGR